MIEDKHLVRLLTAIKDLALLPYPWPDGDTSTDRKLIMALGEIAGIAMKAVQEHGRVLGA